MKKNTLILIFVLLLLFTSSVFSQASEADSKAIAQSILDLVTKATWPKGSGPADGPVKICVVGDSPVKGSLDALAASTSKPVEIIQASVTDDLSSFHVAYNPSSELGSLAKILKGVGAAKVLTVSSAKDFARYGVMVNLAKDGGKFKYEVNTMVLDGSGIKIDDGILKKATKI